MEYKDFYPINKIKTFTEYLKTLKFKFPNADMTLVFQYFSNPDTRDKISISDLTEFAKKYHCNRDTVKLLFFAATKYRKFSDDDDYDLDTH